LSLPVRPHSLPRWAFGGVVAMAVAALKAAAGEDLGLSGMSTFRQARLVPRDFLAAEGVVCLLAVGLGFGGCREVHARVPQPPAVLSLLIESLVAVAVDGVRAPEAAAVGLWLAGKLRAPRRARVPPVRARELGTCGVCPSSACRVW
jgi:hypothetical protein